MHFSCSLPVDDIGEDGFLSIEGISQMAQAIEKAGLDAAFVTDHPAPSRRWLEHGGHATLDPFVALSIVAAATKRIRLHTHILVLAYRNPFIVAKVRRLARPLERRPLYHGDRHGLPEARVRRCRRTL